jgi:hypothetical protein
MVTETTVIKVAVNSATRKSTGRKSPHPAESRTKATAGESAKCVTATTTTDKSVSSTSPAKSATAATPTMTAAPSSVSKSSPGYHG